jgi:hypothetical protein
MVALGGEVVAYFFGGAFVANSIPHLVSGIMGRPFQSPFAKPPGVGLSSSVVNALWGWLNLFIGWLLIFLVGDFTLHTWWHALSAGGGGFLLTVAMAWQFGKVNGGNNPTQAMTQVAVQ